MSWRLALVLVLVAVACTSESERTRQAAEHREARDSLLTAEVVQAMTTPKSAGRLIYERPSDLSYDSLKVKRPELLLQFDRQKR
jgi:hypothetical protein